MTMSKLNKTIDLADQIIEKLSKSGIAGENRKVSVANKILKPTDFSDGPGMTSVALKKPKDVKMSTPAKPHKMSEPVKKEEMDKSNYGPAGMRQYNPTDNIKRKMNNVGDNTGGGPNSNVKAYSSKPGQLSAKASAAVESAKAKKLSSPVKVWSKEEIEAENKKRQLGKSWVNHPAFPNADEEIKKLQKANPVHKAEELMANQLMNMMANKNMLGVAPPPQPTDEEMFGGMVVTEEQVAKAETEWNDVNRWFREATKPISARFKSEEEEQAYWDSIKVADRDDSKSGY